MDHFICIVTPTTSNCRSVVDLIWENGKAGIDVPNATRKLASFQQGKLWFMTSQPFQDGLIDWLLRMIVDMFLLLPLSLV